MDELPNTHFIPSFFEVTESGQRLIKSQFREQFPDVFVGYQTEINAFFVNTNDKEAISALIKIYCTQINVFQNGKNGGGADSPKMHPLKYTTAQTDPNNILASTTQLTKLDLNPLIDLDEDSEDSSDNTSSSGDPSVFWVPKSGNLGILQLDLADGIANLTGCIFCQEPEHRRVRLVSGNPQAALAKLRRLEPLLEHLARHSSAPIPRVDYNILSLSSQLKGDGVCYVPTIRGPHAQRIIAGSTLEDRVEYMFVGEEQVYNVSTGKYKRAENLDIIYAKDEPAVASKIWANYHMKSFGDPEKARPIALFPSASVVSSTNVMRRNEHMGIIEQARVRDWSEGIDLGVDPTQAISAPPLSEPTGELPASARVVMDSDSDDEGDEAEETKYRIVAEDLDDEVISPVTKVQGATQPSLRDVRAQKSPDRDHITRNIHPGRTNRHRNPHDDDDDDRVRGTGNTKIYIAASSFFADVPRDEDGRGEAKFRPTAPAVYASQPSQPTRPRQPMPSANTESRQGNTPTPTRRNRPRRGFGFDGAGDDPEEDQSTEQADGSPKPSNGSTMSVTDLSARFDQTNTYKPGIGFDPNQYGANSRGTNRNSARAYPTQQNAFANGQSQQRPVPTWPQPPMHAGINAGTRRGGGPPARPRRIQDHLIDCSEDMRQQSTNMIPPPGLSPRKRLDEIDITEHSHILDSPLVEIQRPAIRPSWDDHPTQNNDPSISTSNSSGSRHILLNYSIQTKTNKPNIGYMRNSAVDELLALQQKKKSKRERPTVTEQSSERIDPEDEATTRKFYNTMNLTASNGGRGNRGRGGTSGLASGETRTQKAERIAKAKADAHSMPVSNRKPQSENKRSEPATLSKRGQQAAKSNPEMAKLHADLSIEASRRKMVQEFVEQMKDVSEVARLFPGHVELEFQIGQLLVMPSTRIKPNVVYEIDKWKSVFNSGATSAEVFFTNILTTSGADVDGILEAKSDRTKIWDKQVPGPCSVVLEFACQDSSGAEFVTHLDVEGTHSLSKYSSVIQQIGLQCPGRTWDACAVLKGVPAWRDVPKPLQNSIADLIASVFIHPGEKVDVVFRIPSDNSITVRDVTVKRTSRHDSQLAGEKDIQLKIVEVKTLYMESHKKDQPLWRGIEKGHHEMAQDHKVRYEVAVVDGRINASFEKNQGLEVGEMTPLGQSDSSLLNQKRIHCVLDSALRLVDKIDWIGAYNFGTIVQRQHDRVNKEEQAARDMPPTMLDQGFLRPFNMPAGLSVAGPRSVLAARTIAGSTTGTNALMSVHGIRSGTSAEIMTDRSGNVFRIGLGGARIPIDIQEEASIADDVAPGESASVVGHSNRNARGSETVRPDSFW